MSIFHDIRFAARSLRKSPGLASVVILTLGLGIGANTALFSVIHDVLLRPLPYDAGERLVQIRQPVPGNDIRDLGFSVMELMDYREGSRTLEDVVEYHTMWFNLLSRGEPQRVATGVVSWNFFDVLGVEPVLGRSFRPDEDHRAAEPVLLLSHDYWRRSFGGDPAVVGSTVEMNDRIHTIVGVLPPLPDYPANVDVYMPWYACPFRSADHMDHQRQARMITLFGRLKPGATMRAATTDLARVASTMAAEHPDAYPTDAGFGATVTPVREEITEAARPTLLILLGMSGLVLLVACANVANLLLARTARRETELALRSALGADRRRLARELLTESTLLAVLGGALGVILAAAGVDLLATYAGGITPLALEPGVDATVLVFAVGTALVTGLVVGIVPVLLLRRGLAGTLRSGGGRATASRRGERTRGTLVAAQLALAFVLLVGAGLMARSVLALQRVDPGFDPDRVLTMRLDLDFTARRDAAARMAFYDPVLEKVAALPGVRSAALTSRFPLSGGLPDAPLHIEGRTFEDPSRQPRVALRMTTPGYFETLRIPLVRGRVFIPADDAGEPPVVVINRSMAERFWPERDPLGHRISLDGDFWLTVVGVVGDVKQEGLEAEVREEIYAPLALQPTLGASLLVRTVGEPMAVLEEVKGAVHRVDPRQPVAFVRTLEEVRSASVASPRLITVLLSLFALLALAISMAGILGLISYAVAQRSHEIGIRMALGARRERVVWLVVRRGLSLAAAGVAAGAVAALALGHLIRGLLFEVAPTDPVTFGGVAVLLLGMALAAAWTPARRASAIDPARTFRAR